MLNSFLEKKIKNKLDLLSTLHSKNTVSIDEVLNSVKVSKISLISLINEMNIDFDGLAFIENSHSYISLSKYDNVDFFRLSHTIYKNSIVLRCLKFLILNDDEISFFSFIDSEFITKSVAYRIRTKCKCYLNAIGLDIKNNRVYGDEYRIRFLIALLHYKYGLNFYNIYDYSLDIVRKFILSTNDVIDLNYIEQTTNEYGYFEYLLILSWKRKDYYLKIPYNKTFENLKHLFIYNSIIDKIKNIIEPRLNITFTDDDYDYIFLVYLCTNSCVFADKWTNEAISEVHEIVFSNSSFSNLLYMIAKEFGLYLEDSHALKVSIIYFFKKCLFELQCIIPDKNFFVFSEQDPLTNTIINRLSNLLTSWRKVNNIKYTIDKEHIIYLSLQLKFIIRQYMKPVEVFILSDLNAELEIMSLYLNRTFSKDRIHINPTLINAQNINFLITQKNSVIITHKKFEPMLKSLNLDSSNTIIGITVEMTGFEMFSIQKSISISEKNIFLDFIKNS